ncbi:MAG: tRNA 2-thiouridine(34) synthase MnmA [Candidatus Portnoybacteria bacterium CG10_big_fil_rev_8_21_14_0_10_38_18]|uniref:tRNA-specific 2-thiouridylase MnmA n=1 Tax=Candidatus Portnoybacteria bacterium CG10_big_fil_rev_8_21_14_0_10_38_18 TaxID=1974813 RepID=A0A2M8KCT9_9BACT|nr:MAG: tRNA 2-thiouridine(34) synthase MnmA [Candidatus Portnoybacteria bacterium CG10_big_fil_rev_8_21_14_0_10_38_18]
MKKRKKVICAMSGGVDSSVAAAILKKNGYDVIGVFMKFWKESGKGRENLCCSAKARIDAKRVAIKLNIPFYVLDVQKEFKKRVVDYFINAYKKGNTPNPCVECNRWIKFRFLFEKMLELKADYVTTGHYARIGREIRNSKFEIRKLLVARDKAKDQTYFLWTLNQKQLERILFPIGDYKKEQVRRLAKKFGLLVYEKKDSQEICFIPDADIRRFLKSRIHAEKGSIITTDGKKVGEHEGLIFYTIGQRKGIKIGGIGPFYVVKKDFKHNTLIVAQGDFDEALYKREFTVSKTNWIDKPRKFPIRCNVKIRYLHKSAPATIFKIQNPKFKIVFDKPQRAITPGQSAVFYKGNELLGGGIIE